MYKCLLWRQKEHYEQFCPLLYYNVLVCCYFRRYTRELRHRYRRCNTPRQYRAPTGVPGQEDDSNSRDLAVPEVGCISVRGPPGEPGKPGVAGLPGW